MVEEPDLPERAPEGVDFEDSRAFIAAHEAFHDAHPPTTLAILERAVRLGSDSLHGIALQIRRVRGTEPEDKEWWARTWLDFQFLIVVLWRMRQAGVIAAAAQFRSEEIVNALAQFDAALPDLKRMRDVAQHFDKYALDGSRRRHTRPGRTAKVGRRLLEVGSFHETGIRWIDGFLDFTASSDASWDLYRTIQDVRNGFRAQ